MIIGHLGISYLISQLPALTGHPLPLLDQGVIIAAGYAPDWDLLLPGKRGGANHHYSPTHTPFFASIIFAGFYLVFHALLQPITFYLIAAALLLHLAADDLSFWLYRFGLKKDGEKPQIIWLYPFIKRPAKVIKEETKIRMPILKAIESNYEKYSLILGSEVFFILLAFLIFMANLLSWFNMHHVELTHLLQTSKIP